MEENTTAASFTEKEIAEMPPEMRAALKLTPPPITSAYAHLSPEVLAQIQTVSANAGGKEPGGFSWAALFYGPFYYYPMKDWVFTAVSTIVSLTIYGIPLLIPMAFFARKRAWETRKWESREQFWETQNHLDRSAIIVAIVSVIVLGFILKYVFSSLSSTFGTSDPNSLLQQVQDQYIGL